MNHINYSFKVYSEFENSQKAEEKCRLFDETFDFPNCSLEVSSKIKRIFREEVLITSVGRNILKQLQGWKKRPEGPKIKFIENQYFSFTSYDNVYKGPRIFFNLDLTYYYVAQDEKREKFLQLGSIGQVFVHECVHALNYLNNEGGYKHLANKDLLAGMDNMEEQIAICGLKPMMVIQQFCENAFLEAQKKPYRINHRAVLLPPNESITMADLSNCGIVKQIEKQLEQAPLSINTLSKLHNRNERLYGKQLTPLSAAAYAGQEDTVDMLLSRGADPLAQDDVGGALFGALAKKRFEILRKLLNRCQIDPPLKAILFQSFCLATCEFSENHDPIFWKTVADCFRKLMNPSESLIQQVIKHKARGHLIQALLVSGEKLTIDQNGNNLLMVAVKQGDVDLFKELIHDVTFDLEVKNYLNETAVMLALKHTDVEVASELVFYLKEKGAHIPQNLQDDVEALLKPTYYWQLALEFRHFSNG